MGMDVYGESPVNKTGEYFRNNVWWWRPLWNYVVSHVPEAKLTERQIELGQSNDGVLITRQQAVKMAAKLSELIKSGEAAEYAAAYQKHLDDLPDEVCDLCHGTGKRTDMEVKDGCNKCSGKGKVRPFDTWYPFSVENVQEFADFAAVSGGFRIH